jgi:hypothetical protein
MGFFLLSDPPDKYADDDEISPPGWGRRQLLPGLTWLIAAHLSFL